MSLLLLGLLGYFAFRLFRRGQNMRDSRYMDNEAPRYDTSRQNGSSWDSLRSSAPSGTAQNFSGADTPQDFDQDEFLRGAKAAYTRLQDSWDRRDLNDIAQFATEDVMQELRRQAQEDPAPGKTELLLVNASILEVRDEGNLRRVAVYFDVLMREDQKSAHPEQVREVWHFVCSRSAGDSWKLDGIQQLA